MLVQKNTPLIDEDFFEFSYRGEQLKKELERKEVQYISIITTAIRLSLKNKNAVSVDDVYNYLETSDFRPKNLSKNDISECLQFSMCIGDVIKKKRGFNEPIVYDFIKFIQ